MSENNIAGGTVATSTNSKFVSVDLQVVDPRADIPAPATPGSAGIDLQAMLPEGTDILNLLPGETVLIDSGLRMSVPLGLMLALVPRSGMGHKKGLVLGNLVGVIDCDYRGHIFISLWNRGDSMQVVQHGERICQAILIPVFQPNFNVVDDLDETLRGAGGFGHSGS